MDRTSRTRLEQITEDRRALNADAAHIRVIVGRAEKVANAYGASIPAGDMEIALSALTLALNGADSVLARAAERERLINAAISETP